MCFSIFKGRNVNVHFDMSLSPTLKLILKQLEQLNQPHCLKDVPTVHIYGLCLFFCSSMHSPICLFMFSCVFYWLIV